jgi:hypothetical protein
MRRSIGADLLAVAVISLSGLGQFVASDGPRMLDGAADTLEIETSGQLCFPHSLASYLVARQDTTSRPT